MALPIVSLDSLQNQSVPLFEDSFLALRTWSNGITRLEVRTLTLDINGMLAESAFSFLTNNTAVGQENFFGMPAGHLLSVTVRSPISGPKHGQTFAILEIVKGNIPDTNPYLSLISAYVAKQTTLHWPPAIFEVPGTGPGIFGIEEASNPGAGNEFSIPARVNTRKLIITLTFKLATSSTSANRLPRINFSPTGGPAPIAYIRDTQPSDETWVYHFAHGYIGETESNNLLSGSLPHGITGDDTIISQTLNLQSGDVYTDIGIYREDWVIPSNI